MDAKYPELGRRIKKARKAAGLSHDRLAARVGTSRQHLIRLEKGLHAPRPETLEKIAEATETPVETFVDADDSEEESALLTVDPRDFGAAMTQIFDRALDLRLNDRTLA